MSLVYAFLADGSEEVEALMIIDILKRAGIEVQTVSVSDKKEIKSSHDIIIQTDILFEEADFDKADMIFLPGGIPGTPNLANHKGLMEKLVEFNNQNKKIAAICAAPSILGELGLLNGKKATCFPGFEDKLKGAEYTGEKVVTDGNVITAKGLGAVFEMGLELVKIFISKEKADEIASKIQL